MWAGKNTDEGGEERIKLRLHALPVNGELVLWKYQPFDPEDGKPQGFKGMKS